MASVRLGVFTPARVLLHLNGPETAAGASLHHVWNRRCIHSGQQQQPKMMLPQPSPSSSSSPSPSTGGRLSQGPHRPLVTMGSTTPSTTPFQPDPSASSLSILPLPVVLRSLLISTVSSTPFLLTPALAILSVVANSKSRFLDPDRNPLFKYVLSNTIYTQFCAGEHPPEVQQCVQQVKDIGFSGVILGYAREVLLKEDQVEAMGRGERITGKDAEMLREEISEWREGTLKTVDLAGEGNFVNLKFTGAGNEALHCLLRRLPPAPALNEAMEEVCARAKKRGVRLLIDAEQQAVQPTIDDWTIEFQRRYNMGPGRRAVVYGTYQAYLRSTPPVLARHLATAESEGFVLGVKLVRGAYLGVEARNLIWATKQETHKAYDSLAKALITRRYNDVLEPDSTALKPGSVSTTAQRFPEINLVLASHNRASIERALEIRDEQCRRGEKQFDMAYGQLYGMADDISCDLVHRGKQAEFLGEDLMDAPKPYKAVIWGTVGECTAYLLRRGRENKDAASRTKGTRKAMAHELRRRLIGNWA